MDDEAEAPRWFRLLAKACRRSKKHPIARYAQLATVGADGGPRCRTVVVRGLSDAPRGVWFVTDGRSAKATELAQDPRAELCWYFAGLREQYRLRGRVRAWDDAGRAEAWARLSPASRATFLWPPPGTPRQDDDVFPPETRGAHPLECFQAFTLVPERVDVLSLAPSPHERIEWNSEGGEWAERRMRP
ncbi:MAG: pyridoxamine 5'-phosphate oxidase family protein [Myxococcota bacterium]